MGRAKSKSASSYTSGSSYSYTTSSSSGSSSSSSSSRASRRSRRRKDTKKTRRDRSKDRHRRSARRDKRESRRDRRDKSRSRAKKASYPSKPPAGTFCHVCKKPNHWTVTCDLVRNDPSHFPHLNLRDGCPICGKSGHRYYRCTQLKYPCSSCGDLHLTKECPFDHVPVEYHEFFDEVKNYPFYLCTKDKKISWVFLGDPVLDKLLWHCDKCQILVSDKLSECVLCHGARKRHVRRKERHSSSPRRKDRASREKKEKPKKKEGADGAAAPERERERDDGLTFAAISGWIDDTTPAEIVDNVLSASELALEPALSMLGGNMPTTLTEDALRMLDSM